MKSPTKGAAKLLFDHAYNNSPAIANEKRENSYETKSINKPSVKLISKYKTDKQKQR
jgi:hypothetical protein